MNLKDCLNYHTHCMICLSKMMYSSPELIGLTIVETDDGLNIRTGHKEVGLKLVNDGTYKKADKWAESYSKNLVIRKGCPTCKNDFVLKKRSLGMTTYSDKNAKSHVYSFMINTTSGKDPNDGTFSCVIHNETIKFLNNDTMYRVYTFFNSDRSDISKIILPEPFVIPGKLITSLDFGQVKEMEMSVPALKTSKISNKEQMVDKINTLILFS